MSVSPSKRSGRRRRVVWLMVGSSLSVALLAACGDRVGTTGGDVQPVVLRTQDARFDPAQVAWAHLFALHYGPRTYTLDQAIRGLEVSDYGFFLRLAENPRDMFAKARWGFFDGETVQLLPDSVANLAVSADGRYVGWIDWDGPLRLAGRVAKVVVVDLSTGRQIFTDSHGMGGDAGDDLEARYSELTPTFLGFDADSRYAYWINASGSGERVRWRLGAEEVQTQPEAEARAEDDGQAGYRSEVVNSYAGRSGLSSPESVGLGYPNWSPSGDYVAELSIPSRTSVFDANNLRPIPLNLSSRAQYFAGWLPGDRLYAVTSPKRVRSYDPTGPDPTQGRIMVCSLPAGTCTGDARIPGLRDLVLPHNPSVLD